MHFAEPRFERGFLLRVLVIEDDVRTARLIRRILSENGYSVTVAATALRGVEVFEADAYDLVVLDRVLPVLSIEGIGICAQIRRLEPDTPVLMLTALGSMRHRGEVVDTKADDYLVKPFRKKELLDRVQGLLRRVPHAPRLQSPPKA